MPALDRFPDPLITHPRVARGHLDRAVIQHVLDHRQRDVVVDHARPDLVAEQVRVHVQRQLTVGGADLRPAHITLDRLGHRARMDVKRAAPGATPQPRGKQPLRVRGALCQERLLASQLLGQERRDRQHRLAAALDVEVAQIRMPVGPQLQALAHQRDHARDPEAAERQHQHDRPVLLIKQRQLRRIDPLRKHLTRKRLGSPGSTRGSSAAWTTAPAGSPDRPSRQKHAANSEARRWLVDVVNMQSAGNITTAADAKTARSWTS